MNSQKLIQFLSMQGQTCLTHLRSHSHLSSKSRHFPLLKRQLAFHNLQSKAEYDVFVPMVYCTFHSQRFLSNSRSSTIPVSVEQNTEPEDGHKHIVYTDDHVVAYNKRAGLSVYGSKSTDSLPDRPSLIETLPELCNSIQVQSLEVGISLKRYYSGLVLLCKGPDSKKKLERAMKEAAATKAQVFSYLAITVGIPQCPSGGDVSAYIRRDFLHDREMSIVEEENNNTARKMGAMMLASFSVHNLMVNEDLGVALTEVSINKDKWEAVEVLMSHYLSPALGDNLYSSRTQYVMGVPFSASAHSVQPSQQRLPEKLKQALEAHQPGCTQSPGAMPLFMHRHRITLTKFPSRTSSPLVLTAPPPQYFVSMLKQLGLYSDSIADTDR